MEQLFLQMTADFKGLKTEETKAKINQLFCDKIDTQSKQALSHEIELHSKTIHEKIRHLRKRYADYLKHLKEQEDKEEAFDSEQHVHKQSKNIHNQQSYHPNDIDYCDFDLINFPTASQSSKLDDIEDFDV